MNRWFLNSLLAAVAFVILLLTIRAYQIPSPPPKIKSPPIITSPTIPQLEQIPIKIFQSGPREECNATDFKTVLILKTATPLQDSINQLLKQFVLDYGRDYGDRVLDFKLISASIVKGEARLVFEDSLYFTSGGSCRINTIYARIENTAKQFSTVKSVKITGAIFQP